MEALRRRHALAVERATVTEAALLCAHAEVDALRAQLEETAVKRLDPEGSYTLTVVSHFSAIEAK